MAKFDKLAVMAKIGETGMVPVFYHKDLETCKKVVKACYEGGVRAFEFTNRGDFAQEVFGELVKWAARSAPSWHWASVPSSMLPRQDSICSWVPTSWLDLCSILTLPLCAIVVSCLIAQVA